MSTTAPRNLLLVDDEEDVLRTLAESLHEEGYECATARSGLEALELLRRGFPIDVVVTDMRMPEMDGVELTRRVKQSRRDVEVLVLTGYGTIHNAVQAIQAGARNYMIKPLPIAELSREIRSIGGPPLGRRRCAGPAKGDTTDDFAGLVGEHPSIVELKRRIEQFGELDGTVLIFGESGSGKELVARALHQHSPRRDEPFVAVNCGAFTRSLLEDQLFGHRAGAYTGAVSSADGLFVAAGRGTVFLDEIGEMDLDLQVKFLRTLEEREVTPLGSTRPVRWHARVLCATNRDLDHAVAAGRFRRDLFFRVHVLELRVPPLRERREDIPLLARHFLAELAAEGGEVKEISSRALARLEGFHWPGNVRELRNIVTRAHALCAGGVIEPRDLPEHLRGGRWGGLEGEDFPTLERVMREHVLRALEHTSGHRSRAARLLAVDRNRLARMIKRFRIDASLVPPPRRGGRRGSAR